MKRQLHLNVNIVGSGRHFAAWRAEADPTRFLDFDFYRQIAILGERGTFDALFLSDPLVMPFGEPKEPWQVFDPVVLLATLVGSTSRIGLIATVCSTFNEPYNLARRFATLDHLSKGRSAWNIVTGSSERLARNFGLDAMPDHDRRYPQAEEFVDVVTRLWDSWEDGALIADAAGHRFVDSGLVHPIQHRGAFYRVDGDLGVPRSPQGRPVLVQAGSSPQGKALCARIADIAFTVQPTLASGQAFYREIKAAAQGFGRNPDHVKIMPGVFPIVGGTEEEAKRRKAAFDDLRDFDHELRTLSHQLSIDLDRLSLDTPVADVLKPDELVNASHGFATAGRAQALRDGLTPRQMILSNGGAHRQVVGSPEQIADEFELWFRERAADGFNVNFDSFPSGLADFVDHVVPELRRRGIYRTEYEGETLRDHLGLPRPASSYSDVARAA